MNKNLYGLPDDPFSGTPHVGLLPETGRISTPRRQGKQSMNGSSYDRNAAFGAGITDTVSRAARSYSSYDKVRDTGMSLGTGFWVSTLIQLAGGLMSSIFARKPKPIRTPQEMYFEDMVNFYSGLGKRARMNRSMAAAITGKTTDDYKDTFPDDTSVLMKQISPEQVGRM